MADYSLDTRRLVRDQASRVADAADVMLTVSQPFINFNTEMLRALSTLCQIGAQLQERNNELLVSMADHQKRTVEEAVRQSQQTA